MASRSNRCNRRKWFFIGVAILLTGVLDLPQNAFAQTRTGTRSLLVERALGNETVLRASFSHGPTYPAVGQQVQFTDASTGSPTSWRWNFGDGYISRRHNPRHAYASAGFKKVTLVVTYGAESRTFSKTISILPAIVASFTYSPSVPGPGQTIQFTDTSTGNPVSWQWDFGDGAKSTDKNPRHAFERASSYTVTLITSDGSVSRTAKKSITVASASVLSTSFEYAPASPLEGQPIQFTDTSSGSPSSWLWDFGDGTTSTVQNPSHAYTAAGSKTVILTAAKGSQSTAATRVLTVAPARIAAFTYNPASPAAGQEVQFTDLSTDAPTAWRWDFGDGSTSSSRNPSHVFTAAGSFSVVLTITSASGSLTATQTVPVTAGPIAKFTFSPATPAIGQVVQFSDVSSGNPTSWLWDFNDGSTSSDPNPSHVFASPGHYSVSLVAGNASGSGSTSAMVSIGSGDGAAGAYWVSPTGAAAWGDARSETPLAGDACCSLSTANANAAAGDVVYLRGGTYATGIRPANSGTADQVVTFKASAGEVPTISASTTRAITIVGKSYIKVDGIHSSESQAFFFIGSGACYNEITNCVFDKSSGQYSVGLITFYNTAFTAGAPSNHNWLHHNVFSRYGKISNSNDLGTVRIAGHRTDPSAHNTLEDNVFFYGGHDNLDVGGSYNVVRNNLFHNEEAYYADTTKVCKNMPASGYFGNRNIILTNYGDGPGTAQHTLIEGNRIGYAGTPPDDDGAMGIENAGLHTVVRYNDIYGNGASGYYSKMQGVKSGSWARVYNNTIYANGFGDPSIGTGFKYGVAIWSYRDYDDWPENVVIKNNIVFGNRGEWKVATDNILPQIIYENNVNTDPGFVAADLLDKADRERPDLRLQPGSPCIDAGAHLTQARGSGSDSVTLIVEDARLFQDGTWGSALTHGVSHFPDWIAVGTVANIVKIASIDNATNTIVLASPATWTDTAKIWLYSDSNGRRVIAGIAPDAGAHEY